MDLKVYALVFIVLVGGIAGGYAVGNFVFQSRISELQTQILDLQDSIAERVAEVDTLKERIDDLEMEKQITIEKVDLDIPSDSINVTVGNPTTFPASIKLITVYGFTGDWNSSGWYRDTSDDATGVISSGDTVDLVWNENDSRAPSDFLAAERSYIIRVYCATEYYAEYWYDHLWQMRVWLNITEVDWDTDEGRIMLTVENMGALGANNISVDGITIKTEASENDWYTDTSEDAKVILPVEETSELVWSTTDASAASDFVSPGFPYMIKVIWNTNEYTEIIVTIPAGTYP